MTLGWVVIFPDVQDCNHGDDLATITLHAATCPTCAISREISQLQRKCQSALPGCSSSPSPGDRLDPILESFLSFRFVRETISHSCCENELAFPLGGQKLRSVVTGIASAYRLSRKNVRVKLRSVQGLDHQWSPYAVNFHILHIWLQNSLAKHTDAEGSVDEPTLPTRILDLAPDGCSQCILGLAGIPDSAIKLVEPLPGNKTRYLTLSHRWGYSHTLRLTLKTRDAFMSGGIPVRSIPKTYRDAIAVARHLGFRYLWIDAMCIIQDDTEDWRRESLRMASVYLNAACTIAAHVASGDDAGFLTKSFEPLAAARVRHGTSYIQDRGWVFQERGLSRRLLHFCAGRVLFEDHAGICTTSSWRSTQGMFHVLREGYAPLEGPKPDLADFNLAPTSWYSVVVAKYSGCKLTYDSDRLPAIAGIARYYGQLDEENHYLFGLWSKTLHVGLLWIARDARRATQREDTSPSWSWTRWPGRVDYPLHLETCEALFEIETMPLDAGLLGQTTTAGSDLEKLPPATSLSLGLKTRVVNRHDVKLTPVTITSARLLPFGSEVQTFELHHREEDSVPSTTTLSAWMTLDYCHAASEEPCFSSLSLALITREEHIISSFYWEDSREPQWESQKLYYFLLLQAFEVEGSQGHGGYYRRVGLGVSLFRWWWSNETERSICIV